MRAKNRTANFAAVQSETGAWTARVELGPAPLADLEAEDVAIPGGPWPTESDALDAAQAYATRLVR